MTPPYQWVQRMSRVLISLRQHVCPHTLGAQRGGSLFVQWKNIFLLPSRRPRISLFSSRDLLNLSDPDPLFVSADSNFTSELFHKLCPPFFGSFCLHCRTQLSALVISEEWTFCPLSTLPHFSGLWRGHCVQLNVDAFDEWFFSTENRLSTKTKTSYFTEKHVGGFWEYFVTFFS